MKELINYLYSEIFKKYYNPLFFIIPLCAIGLIILLIFIIWIRSILIFKKKLKQISENNDLSEKLILSIYSKRKLLKWSGIIEKFAEKYDRSIISLLGIDQLWIAALLKTKNKKFYIRVLKYSLEKGLYECFLTCLIKPQFAPILIKWFEEKNDALYLKRIAYKSNGQEFDIDEAYRLFYSKIDDIREITGDQEWVSRLFAAKIILKDNNEKSKRSLWDLLNDSNYNIRKLVIKEFLPDDRDKFYNMLFKILISDPIYDVRKASWERIQQDFQDLFKLESEKLSDNEKFHIIELLRSDNKNDENFALNFLKDDNLELRFIAAKYLDECGSLTRLCIEVDMGDKEMLQRNFDLLNKASEVNITNFLISIERTDNIATLYLSAKILCNIGDSYYINILAKKVFSLLRMSGNTLYSNDLIELYQITLECISKRGTEKTLRLLDYELNRRQNDEIFVPMILMAIPDRADHIFFNTLVSLLKNPDFKFHEQLRISLLKMPDDLLLSVIFEIIKDSRKVLTHNIKIQALKILAEMKMYYCLQVILENLYFAAADEARDFANILKEYPEELLTEKIMYLYKSVDASIRASIISILSSTGNNSYLKLAINGLKDSDPYVRIASIFSIIDYQAFDSLSEILELIRDPIENVRIEAGKALGEHGTKQLIEELEKILENKNEVFSVKKAIISGLSHSTLVESVYILIKFLELNDDLEDDIIKALSGIEDKDLIKAIIENFKTASPKLKIKIVKAFKLMSENIEGRLAYLLKNDNGTLRPYITEILESTGYIQMRIKKLSHKNPEIRRKTAKFLSHAGTKSAYKGLIMAVRDPDEEVRITAIKALEALESSDGNKILDELKNDPDNKVRKYTLWAIEKLKAKSLKQN